MTDATIPLEDLLAHREWLRALARSLVRDDAAADDLAQDAWVTALRAPPPSPLRSPRAWLARIVRHRARDNWRGDERRAVREAAVANTDDGAARAAHAAAESAAARVEVEQRTAAAVLALDEPYRGALLLTYYDGMSSSEAAARLQVPAATVRSWSRRGLERLRAELDAAHDGDRRAWLLPMLALADSPPEPQTAVPLPSAEAQKAALAGASSILFGSLLMATKTKITIALAATVLALFGLWTIQTDDGPDVAPTPVSPEEVESLNAAVTPRRDRARTTARAASAAPDRADAAPAETEPAPVTTVVIAGRVLDEAGVAFEGATVWPGRELNRRIAMRTASDGRFRIVVPLTTTILSARGPGTGTSRVELDLPEDAAADSEHAVDVIRLGAGLSIEGTVVGVDGAPAQAVRVRAWGLETEYQEWFSNGRRAMLGGDDVITDEHGRFVLSGLDDEPYRVFADLLAAPSLRAEPAEFASARPGGTPLTFRLVAKTGIVGRVVEAETGTPIARFTFDGVPHENAQGEFTAAAKDGGSFEVRARGYLPHTVADLALADGETRSGLLIELQPDPDVGTLSLTIADPDGNPIPGCRVEGTSSDFQRWVEPVPVGVTALRVDRLKSGSQVASIMAPGFALKVIRVTVVRGRVTTGNVTLEPGGAIRLRLLDTNDRVVSSAKIRVVDDAGTALPMWWKYTRPQGTLFSISEWYGADEISLGEADGTLQGIAAGKYTLRIERKGADPRDVAIEIPVSGTVTLDIR